MDLRILTGGDDPIVEVISAEIVINTPQDALDLMVAAGEYDAQRIIIREQHLHADFFELRTGLAGEIAQKSVNYQVKLAVVGSFEKYQSNSLRAFMLESNRGNLLFFVADVESAITKLSG